MKNIKIVKDSLRIMNSSYVSSEQIDEASFDVRFTYKKRNYILHINSNYKFMMLETYESVNGMNFNNDTLELINYIRDMISFTEFEDYNIFAISCRKDYINGGVHKIIQTSKGENSIIDFEKLDFTETKEYKGEVCKYNFGLDSFDKRLFDSDWLEDFSEKVCTFSNEDLFIMESTFIAYYYKMVNNLWKDEIVDPFIISYASSILYKEIKNRLGDRTFENWFSEWSSNFTKDNLEEYLKNRNKGKSKELCFD